MDLNFDKFRPELLKNAFCTNRAQISYGGFSQIRSHIMNKLVQDLLSVIRFPLLGGFIIAWIWLIAKIDDVIQRIPSQVGHMEALTEKLPYIMKFLLLKIFQQSIPMKIKRGIFCVM